MAPSTVDHFSTAPCEVDAVEAHSCVDPLMPNSFFEQNTTVNDKSTAGCFDPKVFVNCVQDPVRILYAVDKDLRVETSCS